MAKQSNNVVTHGISGKIGDLLVFRVRDGKTVVSKVPQKRKFDSEKQKGQQRKFQRAVLYARSSFADPETAEAYKKAAKKGQTGYNVAVADFFHAPDIQNVDVSGYTGQPGDIIRIEVSDNFMVKEVNVSITNADGSLVEEGAATPDAAGYLWIYTATAANSSLEGDRIEISASDLPGNVSQDSVNI
jgi:hypothetical protein